MNNLRNEKIRSVLLALLLAVSFLILESSVDIKDIGLPGMPVR